MNRDQLIQQIKTKQSYLCVGLDTDRDKLPPHFKGKKDAVATFNKAIIEATKEHCVAYKINTAFYESAGIAGWQAMEETLYAIPPTHFTIADAKRGDIGNTSAHYAKTFFETLPFDAVTVNPYMGEDSVRPFLEYENKITILLGLTSNTGAQDFELKRLQSQQYLYEWVLETAARWGTIHNLMFVIGATQTEQLASVRKIIPDHFLLVPGVGAQGGSLADVSHATLNQNGSLMVNASRAIIFAGSGEDFNGKAAAAAAIYHEEMKQLLQHFMPV